MWLAADYDTRLIRSWFASREWPTLDRSMFSYYRKQYGLEIERLRTERRRSALNSGLALKEERVARLAAHADELEALKWVPDDNGRLWNEKAWRETLDDIAREVGDRRAGGTVLNVTLDDLKQMSDQELEDLAHKRGLV